MLLDDQNAVIDTAGDATYAAVGRFARAEAPSERSAAPAPALCTAAGLSMENRLLRAELRAQEAELRAAQARLVAAADAERRRLERDLHDGAQSRLVALALELRRAQAKAPPGGEVARLLEHAVAELATGLAELRDLARGIHPAVLTDRGLDAALEALAGRAGVPVRVRGAVGGRLAAAVELGAYFVVSEALANVAKYAEATHAVVDVRHEAGRLVIDVRDDGRGGADPADGTGLRGLADRVGALDGRILVDSPPGAGTRVRAEIPCRAPHAPR